MKKPAFFAGCMALQGRVALRRLPALLAMALAGLLLSGLVALAGRSALAGQGFAGLTLVVAAEEEDPQLETLLDMLAGMEELRQVAAIRRAAPDEAEALVQSGAAAAAVVLPAGFLPSVMQGENLAPRLLVDSSRPVEMALVSQVAQSAVAMLTRAQQGIAFTLEYYDTTTSGAPKRATVVQGINLAYASWVLGREGMFRPEIHQAGGAMGLVPHYLLGAALFFVLLCLPVLHRLYALPAQGGWLGRLRSAGCPLPVYVAAQLAAGALALLPTLALLLAGVWLAAGASAAPGPVVLPVLLVLAGGLSCYGFLLGNLGGLPAAAGLNFLLATLALLCSGGLVPLVLLPGPLAALAPFSPIGWMRRALAPLFGLEADPAATALCVAGLGLLLGVCLLLARLRERRAAP